MADNDENAEPQRGDKYRHLIRTRTGYTVDNRCGQFCLDRDVIAWGDAARDLSARVNRAWKELIRVETGPGDILGCGPGGQPEECPSDAIRAEVNAYFGEADDLPGWWEVWVTETQFWTPTTARARASNSVISMGRRWD